MVIPPTSEPLDTVLSRGVAWARRSKHRAIAVLMVDVPGSEIGDDATEATMDAVALRLAEIWNVAAVRIGHQFVVVSTTIRSNFDAVSLAKLVARAAPCPVRIGVRVARHSFTDGDVLLRDAQYALDEAHRRSETVVMFSRELCLRRSGAEYAE